MSGKGNKWKGRRGARGRGRGYRGCLSSRGSQGVANEAANRFYVGSTLEDGTLLQDSPLETPLHPKRLRKYQPPPAQSMAVDKVETKSAVPNPWVVPSPLSPTATFELTTCDSDRESGTPSTSSGLVETKCALPNPWVVPSPLSPTATFELTTCGGSDSEPGTPSTSSGLCENLRRPLEVEIEIFDNYGSEDESVDSGDDANDDVDSALPVFIPRLQRLLLFPDEEEEEEEEAQPPRVQTPSSASPMLFSEEEEEEGEALVRHGPTDLFHFDWVDFPSVPVAPADRRETFRAGEVGPTAVFSSPYEAFTAVWTREFMQRIVDETNRYAQQMTELKMRDSSLAPNSRINDWRDTNVDELYVFFALVLSTGTCVKGLLKDYWLKDDITSTPGFGHYMSYNRFTLLNACLHFVDNRTTNLRTMTRSQARIYKIQPVVQHLNDRFQALYRLGRNVSMDESLTKWMGLLSFKQFIRNKAAGQGIKTFELCESQTGYLWRFKIYSGRDEKTEPEKSPISGYTANLVLEFLEGLEGQGYTVWMDNYYNSPALARILKTRGFDCAGTLRTNRQDVPSQIKSLTAENMAPGQLCGATSGDVDIVAWRDARRVAAVSTFHGAGVHAAHAKVKPIVVHDYNVCMGGVDKKDQILSAYPIERKRTRNWYKKFFKRLLNASVFNAFILHRERAAPNSRPHIRKHRIFRRVLVKQLLAKHQKPPNFSEVVPICGFTSRVVLPREALRHFPKMYGYIADSKKERIRRTCVVCRKRQPSYCPACNVPLCAVKCSELYHS